MKTSVQSRIMLLTQRFIFVLIMLVFSGCASIGVVANAPKPETAPPGAYSIEAADLGDRSGDITFH